MVEIIDQMLTIIAGLTILCCCVAFRIYWKDKNTDAFMWVLVTFFWCVGALSKSLQL